MGPFDAAWEHESRRTTHTDATGMLLCRSCGASGSKRAGGVPIAARCSSASYVVGASLDL
jgi:hypothetical protein